MEKILFIYNNPLDGSYGGAQRTKQALSGLETLYDVIPYSCIKSNNKFLTILRNLFGYSGSLSKKDIKRILQLIRTQDIKCVFCDVSLFGILVRKIKNKFENVKIVVNYHNCEAKYFGDMFKTKGLLYYPIYRAAVYNEKLSIKYADFHVLLSEEDRKELEITTAYCIIPATLQDIYLDRLDLDKEDEYILFVGSPQYANIEGAKYLIDKIAPRINKKIVIVGRNMTNYFKVDNKNIKIYDFVDDLQFIYKNASAFIAPLFYGSGVKIKVAEAFMYGKKVLGTSLAFFGYDLNTANVDICNNEEQFISAINKLDMKKKYYEENRVLFLEKYSYEKNNYYYGQIKLMVGGK